MVPSRENDYQLACSTLQYDFGGWELKPALEDIARAGFEGIELTVGGRYPSAELQPGQSARALLEATGMKAVSLSTSLFWAGDSQTQSSNQAEMSQILELARDLGVSHVGVVTGPWPEGIPRQDAEAQIIDSLRWAIDQADGIPIALETIGVPWPDSYWLAHDLASFKNTRDAVGDKLRAKFDVSNYLGAGDDPVAVVEELRNVIAGVHLKDALRVDGRCVPAGEGDADFPSVIAALSSVGYSGWLVVEDESWTSGHGHHPDEQSRSALQFYAGLLNHAGSAR